ncbi:thrombospondin type-1 domain-containing protein [Flavobacterium sp. 5]|uniref:thrombospondin type-1 domain-containing protein n=1 Tax=Flavobacterium sp. 5 TaxID=2035199 RepID=UPI000C2BF6EE|nr:thrombospondin type-1 domain-containing protein [Flavobacterium sp. 5]PKB18392.1 hypothetical protein CLU82_3667 [Flavobacterium sp. 5]
MVVNQSLKFIKKQNGNVLLLKKEDNSFIASFIPSLTIERDKNDANRFEVMSQYIDYRSIDCEACSPVIVADNFDEFLIELSENFFFLNKKNCCNKFGRITLKDKGVNNCILNTGEELEAGDIVSYWIDLDNYCETGIYHGGDTLDNDNFEPLTVHNMGTSCSLPIDAVVSDWSDWSSCLDGEQSRTRTVIIPAYNGGNTPVLVEIQSCSITEAQVIAGNHYKPIKNVSSVRTDKIKSTVNVYFDGVLANTNILDIVADPSYDSIGDNFLQYALEGVVVMIEQILEPTNDVAVKSEIKNYNYPDYISAISTETVLGTLGSVVTNTLTFVMPSTPMAFVATADFI